MHKKEQSFYTRKEVAQHASIEKGVWVIHDNKVYDVTKYVAQHPGGSIIMNAGGQVVDGFWERYPHSDDALEVLGCYKIGQLREEKPPPPPEHQQSPPLHQEIPAPQQAQQTPTPEVPFAEATEIPFPLTTEQQFLQNLLNLQRFHDQLDIRMKRHQQLLFEGNIERALKMLRFFYQQLRIHMKEELQVILPAFKQRAPYAEEERIALGNLFEMDLRSLRHILREAIAMLDKLLAKGGAPSAEDIIQVLDKEATFKSLLEKVDEQDIKILYPGAQHAMQHAERKLVWEQCFHIREYMGFRLGDAFSFTWEKLHLLVDFLNQVKEQLPALLVEVAKEQATDLPFSTTGEVEIKVLSDVLEELKALCPMGRKLLEGKMFRTFAADELDEFIGIVIEASRRAALTQLNLPEGAIKKMEEAWAAALNTMIGEDSVLNPLF